MILILLILSILIGIISKVIMKSYITPYSIFLQVFIFASIVLFSSDFLNKEITHLSIMILILSMLTFSIGSILAFFDRKFIKKQSKLLNINYDNLLLIIKIIFVLSMIGFTIYTLKLNSLFGIINILKNPVILNTAIANDSIQVGIEDYLMILSVPNTMFLIKYIYKYKDKKYLIVMYILQVAININVKRSRLFYIVVLNLFMYMFLNFQSGNKITFYKVKKSIKVFTGFLVVGIFSLNIFSQFQTVLNKQSSITGSVFGIKVSESIVTMITYFSGNIVSLGEMLNIDFGNITFGTATFRFVYKFLDKLGILFFDDRYLKMYFVNIPTPYNTAPMQYYIYRDFNMLGIVVLFFIIGYASSKIYIKFLNRSNEFTVFYLSLVCMLLFLSIREYVIIFLDFWIILAVLIIGNMYSKEKEQYCET